MRCHRHPISAFISAVCLFLPLVGVRVSATSQWMEVRSPHFRVVTDGGEKRGREAALRFELIRATFGQLFSGVQVNVPVPVEIVAFRNGKELRQFSHLWQGKPVEVAGFFQSGEDRDFIALDLSAENGWDTVFHEFTHLMLHANLTDIPLWFDEGFAEYFASLKVERGTITLGGPSENHAYPLRTARWMPLEALFTVQHNSPVYNENGNHRSVFYAQSWLVVHYLTTKRMMPQVTAFARLRADGVSVAEAWQRAFGIPLSEFDKILHDYFGGRALIFRGPAPTGPDLNLASYSSHPLSDTESEAVLADLHLHERDYQETAVKEFEQVLAKQPDNATANRGLGYAYLRKGDFERAEQHLKKAVAAGSNEAETHYLYALMLMRRRTSDGSNDGDSSRLEVLKKEVQAAIGLNAEYADAYNLLAFAQAAGGDFQSAIASENHAFQLSHLDAHAMNLAQYCMQARRFDDAEALLQKLSKSSNESIAATAGTQLQQLARLREYEQKASARPPALAPRSFTRTDEARETSASAPQLSTRYTVAFARGKLLRVDCSSGNEATLTVKVGDKTWSMHTKDRSKLVLINADTFSCEWKDRSISTNYRQSADGERELMSLEFE